MGTGRGAHVTRSGLFPKPQPFATKATFKGWVIPRRNSKHLASKFNFILLAHLLQKPFLGKLLLMQRPYKSKTSWSPSLKITEPHFRYSKANSCHSIETEESKA